MKERAAERRARARDRARRGSGGSHTEGRGGEVLEVVRRVSGKEWKIGKEGCRRGKRLGLPVEVGHGANS